MRALPRLTVWLRSWFRPGHMDAEFAEELRFHLERQIEVNTQAGMGPEEARRAALLTLGHLESIKEASRDARTGALARQIARDILYGGRLLRKAPVFALASILIIALGIGTTTAIFSVLYGVVLKPLSYADPARLVGLWTRLQAGTDRAFVNGADYRDWRAANHVFEDIALVRHIANFNLIGTGEPERLFAARISANLLPVLGVTPAIGRGFTNEENEIGRDHVVLLSDGLWRRRFGADPSILGRDVNLSGVPHTVVGIMRPDFQYPGREYQVWTPLTVSPTELARTEPGYNHLAVARLKRGVSVAQAQSEMDMIAKRLATTYPATWNGDMGVAVAPLLEETVGAVRPALYVMFAAVSCLLLIACLNLANLLGARAASRTREYAVRLALGASRGRLMLQAFAEVGPLLAFGGALGVVGAAWAVSAFVPLAPPALPRVDGISIDGPVLAFSVAAMLLTGMMGGLLPAMQAWQSDLATATHEESRSTVGGRSSSRTRDVLVVAQVALVLPLLVGAGLLARSFSALVQVDPGFRPDNVLSLHLAIPRSKYPADEDLATFCSALLRRTEALPGVASVGMVNRLPLAGGIQILALAFEGFERQPAMAADTRTITPDYFRTMGIPLIEGRVFTEHDTTTVPWSGIPNARFPTIGIVDERIARTLWPGQSALGNRFRAPFPGAPWVEIVGVVGHIRHDGLDVDLRPQVYFNYRQRAQDRMVLVIKGKGDARALTSPVIEAVRSVDPEQPVYDVRTMDEVVDRSTAPRWLNMALVAIFGGCALVLASVGLYGSVAYGVTQRTREFGLRLALGANRLDIVHLVLGRGTALAAIGAIIGLAGALFVTKAMSSVLFGVQPLDLVSFVAAISLFVAVALLASYLPARRAALIDPAITLRCE